MSLETRLTALAMRVGNQFKNLVPRLNPAGGSVGQILARTGAADYVTGWVSRTFTIPIPCQGKPLAGEVLADIVVVEPFSIASGLAGSAGTATATATNSSVCTLTKNGTVVGTFTYAPGASSPTLAAASAINYAVNDRLKFIAPSTQDATLADFTNSLLCTR